MSTMNLHLCGITTDGKLWHTSRASSGSSTGTSWSPWEEVKPQGITGASPFVSVACGVRYIEETEEIHLCTVTQDGRLWYTNRDSSQDWQPFENLQGHIQGDWGSFQVQSVAFDHFFLDACVIVLVNNGQHRILHTHRHFDGSWDDFEDASGPNLAAFPGSFVSVGCSSTSPSPSLELLNVCGVSDDGKLWHTLRSFLVNSFSWLPFADVQKLAANGPGRFSNVSLAQGPIDLQGKQNLHIFAQGDGDLWHTVRTSNPPAWSSPFDSIKKQAGNPGSFGSIGCANVDEQVHVCAVTADGKLWHTSYLDPTGWQPFENVSGTGGASAGVFSSVCLAVIFTPVRTGSNAICQRIAQNLADAEAQLQGDDNNQIKATISNLQRLSQQNNCP